MTQPTRRRQTSCAINDANQVRLWRASLAICDGRLAFPRALAKAIRMIEDRDREIERLNKRITVL